MADFRFQEKLYFCVANYFDVWKILQELKKLIIINIAFI